MIVDHFCWHRFNRNNIFYENYSFFYFLWLSLCVFGYEIVMRKSLLFFSCILLFQGWVHANWTYPIRNYTRNDYKAGSQNWQIIQNSNHWMYFANKMGILEFNGCDWELYTLRSQTDVRSLMKSEDGKRIYAGGVNELGYLEPGINGKMQYHSISSEMPEKEIVFGNIWNIFELNQSIYFCADQSVVRWKDNHAITIPVPDKIDCSNAINGTLYVGTNSGIFILAGDAFYKLPHLEPLINKKIRGIYALGDKLLIATALDGLFLFEKDNLTPFLTKAGEFIKKNELFSVAVSDNSIAIGTVLNGVVIISHTGEITGYYNESHGLHNNTVLSVYFDNNKNLWLGLDNGIACIALSSPVTNLYAPPNFYGAGYATALYNGKLYLGTNRGLYYIDWPLTLNETAPELKMVEHLQGQVWGLHVFGNDLFCCLDKGLFVMEGNSIRTLISGNGVWSCTPTVKDSGKVFVSTYTGFYLMERQNNKWLEPHFIEGYNNSFINFEESNDGFIYARNSFEEVLRLQLNNSKTKIIEAQSIKPNDIPTNPYVYKIGNQIKLCSPAGIYTCENETGFVPDENLNAILETNDNALFRSIYDIRGNIWALGTEVIGVYYPNTKHFFKYRHNIPLITNFERLYVLNDLSTIICNENGFALWSVNSSEHQSSKYELQIFRVNVTKPVDSLIYMNSCKAKPEIKIPHKNNALRFEFDLIDYVNADETLLRCRLDDEPWSDYSTSNVREYSWLHVGKHVFKVETKRIEGIVYTDELHFEILPPWYRTNMAYSIYLVLFIVFVFGVWYWDDKRIKRKEHKVEEEQKKAMQEKEDEYRIESEKKEQEIVQLKNEQLEMEVKHKNQELANNAINLARKNEVLLDIKADISKVSDEILNSEKVNATSLRRMILRLNNKIEENIFQDDSLQRFEEHFDLVHNKFMLRLSEKYPSLTLNERKMCAFVKMHLSSKEIAPLLGISVRGVETLRYRLRKKLELNPEESLTAFLNSF